MPSKTEDAAASPDYRTLGESINIATRPVHTSLNKLIILRLRLALPPQADDASNYVQGLLHITPIYTTFESLWREILESSPAPVHSQLSAPKDGSAPSTGAATASPRIHDLLFSTHIPTLSRSDALRADLVSLTGWTEAELAAQLAEVSASPVLQAFLSHTRRSVSAKPHVLLAYAWVLYMALFAGGRFIRASLERVDPRSAFWGPLGASASSSFSEPGGGDDDDDDVTERMPGGFPSSASVGERDGMDKVKERVERTQHPLSFFRFASPSDGQDLRQTFKARVADATWNLAAEEIDDVVAEARQIFERMIGVVGELDEVCGTEFEEAKAAVP
ncbi:heme oxygenase-like protein [Jackrogersella minutella]|nr:heme oxygenase-like protein [Jackrogersella minutella]